ncbi:MAG TPA: hypothetical protein VGD18_01180, partial [Thiobacillaceae bacterium]
MNWVMFAIGAALSWGMYGPMLHKGQVALGNPMRALLCVGVAYLLVAILIPFLILSMAAIGLNILVGYCGQISLGTGGFMAVGAY